MTKVRVGIVGCGWFGNFHLDNLLKIDGVEIIALVSSNSEKLKRTGEKACGARLYANYKDMFETEKQLDAVFICVPPDSHQDAEIIAAEKGIHLYIEKPIEVSLEKSYEIEAAIKKAGIINSVGYQERYNEETAKIKSFIENRKVGLVSGRWLGGIPGAPWWRRRERSGGQIVEQSTHIIDMLRYFFGEAVSVYSSGVKGLVQNVPDYNIEDCSSTIINFKSGVIATVFTACYLDELEGFSGAGLQIVCNDAVIEYDWNKEVRYTLNKSTKKILIEGGSHEKAVKTFIDAIKTGEPKFIKSTYSDAVKTFELTLAANESINSLKPVKL
jgi:myo-inositol 2-dehydrogenase / D-chiro-inositol 1-dehydrogenase